MTGDTKYPGSMSNDSKISGSMSNDSKDRFDYWGTILDDMPLTISRYSDLLLSSVITNDIKYG